MVKIAKNQNYFMKSVKTIKKIASVKQSYHKKPHTQLPACIEIIDISILESTNFLQNNNIISAFFENCGLW